MKNIREGTYVSSTQNSVEIPESPSVQDLKMMKDEPVRRTYTSWIKLLTLLKDHFHKEEITKKILRSEINIFIGQFLSLKKL